MRFSVKSHSKLYLIFIFAIVFYVSGEFSSFYGLDQHRVNVNIAFGQFDDGQNENKKNIPNTIINTAVDGNNNVIVNNGSTTSNSMKFAFSGMDNMGKTINRFECSIDGRPYVTCISTNTVNVVDGTHTFRVRSEDNAGNKDTTPASYTWTANTETSNTQIDSVTDGNKMIVINNSNTRSNSMTFAFSGTDNVGAKIYRFECSMNGEPFVTCISTNTVNVVDGTHTFSVRSEDNAGNKDSTPASFTWSVDTTPPTTSIISAVDGNNSTISNNGKSESSSIKFSFAGNDTGGVGIDNHQCNIDNSIYVACTSPFIFPNLLKDGSHTFTVLSEDNAGNKDASPASFTWSVDTTPPTTSIISAVDGNNSTISNNGNSKSTSIKFAFSGTDTGGVGVDHLQCNIDNSPYVACTSPFVFLNSLKDGTHAFTVRAVDAVGNINFSPASFKWTVDTESPTTTINAATDGNEIVIDNGTNSNSNSMSFEFSGNDTGGNEGTGVGINHFECNIDNSIYVACTSPFIFPNLLKDGSHTFTVLSEDNAGNKDSSPASFTWTVDTLAPIISIDSATDGNEIFMIPESNTSSNEVTLAFSGNDTGGQEGKGVGIKQFECALDGASFSICTSPVQFTSVNLPEGTHTFQIISEDNIGNINSSPESFSWTVDTEPPTTSIDSSIDGFENNVTGGGNTASNSITLAFSAIDSGGKEGNGVGIKQFECNIDNSEFVSCTSPLQFINLTDGGHTLEIMSEDNVGNLSPTPASFNWTVDTVPPSTTIINAIDGNESPITNGSYANLNSISFSFSGNDTNGAGAKGLAIKQFECSLDDSNFTVCSTPAQFTSANITDGTHTFRVLSEDNVGNNDPSPELFTWTVDTIAPTTNINSAIDGNNSTITNSSNTKSNSVMFEFSGNDTGGVGIDHLECSLDGTSFSTCTSPVQFTSANITDGTHTFEVLSVDNSTNKDPSPASFTWIVDTIPPETSILSAIDGNESIVTTGQNTSSNLISFEFSGNDTGGVGIDHLECSLDGTSFSTCTSPVQFTSANITDGTHTFEVLSVDNSTNKDPSPASFNWTVDTIAPTTNINSAIDGNNSTITNSSNTKSNAVMLEFSGNDTGGVGIDHLECSLDGTSFSTCTSPVQFTSTNLLDGTHSFMVIAQDKVGNMMTTPVLFNWTVDTLPPTTAINTAIDGNNGTLVSGNSTMSTSMSFTFSGNDRGLENNGVGIKQIECSIDNSNFTACVSPIEYSNLTEGVHRLEVVSEDKVGNKGSIPSSFNWTIDTKAPSTSIFSATDGNNNFMAPGSNTSSNSMTFEFSANDTGGSEDKGVGIKQIECSIDSSNFTACVSPVEITPDILTDGNHSFKVRAEDNVGNMNPEPASFSWTIDTVSPTTIISNVVDGNNSTITNSSNTKSNGVMFEFSGNDTGVGISNFECSIDNSNFSTCSSPVQFTSANITDGTHTFEVLSVDNSTNKDPSPASFIWTVDTIAPTTIINSAIDGNNSTITNSSNTKSNAVMFEFSGNDTGGVGIDHLECSLDGTSFSTCTSPVQFTSANITDGTHTFEVLSVDNSTNKDPSPASFNWTVDTIAPTTNINSAIDGNNSTITNSSNTKSNAVMLEFSGNDTGGVGIDHLECSLDGTSFSTCTSPVQFTSTNLLDGTHSFMVIAQDKVGNMMTTPVLFNWTVDTLPPTTAINTAIDGNNGTLVSGNSTMSTSMSFTFSGNDRGLENNGVGIKQIECSIDNSNFTACVSPIEYSNLTEGVHRLEVVSEDKVGNKGSIPSSFNWTIDTKAPSTSIFSATDGNNNFMAPGSNTSSSTAIFEFSANDTGGSEDKGVGIKQIECSIDSSNFTACVSPVEITPDILTDGNHSFKVRAEDNVGNMNPEPASFSWTIDTVSPTTIISNVVDGNNSTITNSSNTKSNGVMFEFSGNDTGVGISNFECSIDNSNFSTCSSPVQFTSANITDGTHTFEVLSVDNSTNKDPSPASFIWTVDTIAPTTIINSAIDGNNSTITNSSNTKSNAVMFEFSGNDTGGVGIDHLECSLDGTSFSTCTSPVQFTSANITDGTHTFEVLSVDNSTNKDPSPASFNWTVDTIAPTTNINSAIDGNNSTITNSSNTKSNAVMLEFSGNDTGGVGIDHLECSLDGTSFSTCTSPVQFTSTNLLDGTHSFMVIAQDKVGNMMTTPVLFNWTVDTLPPTTAINTAIDGNNGTLVSGNSTMSTSMSFTFSGNDRGLENNGVGIKQIECSIDNSNFTACVSPIEYSNLTEGVHRLEVVSEDKVGNKGSIPSSFNWTIDTKAPSTSIFSATDGNNNFMAPGSNTSSSTAIFEFSANDTGGSEDKGVGIKQIECSIDSSNFTACVSPVEITPDILTDGNHSFKVRAEDNVGNMNPEPASFSWTIDTVSPTTIISNVVDGNNSTITNSSNIKSNTLTFEFSGNDTGVGISNFECSIDNSNFSTCSSPVQSINLTEGDHTVKIRAQDSVGNIGVSPASFSWSVDTEAPLTSINSVTDGNNTAISTGGNTSSNTVMFEFSGTDSGVGLSHFECSLDESEFITCSSPLQINSLTDGIHTLETRAHDNVGNKDLSLASFTWTVDTIAPTTIINSAIDGNNSTITNSSNTKSNAVMLEFSGNDTGGVGIDHLECSLDGTSFSTCTSPVQFTSTNLLDGTHSFMVIAQDKVGNMMTTPVLFNWTVDTLPPTTAINTAIDGNNGTLVSGNSTMSTSMSFTFSGNDRGLENNGVGIKQIECSIDNSNFTACVSPIEYSNLTEGVHRLEVVSEDKVGNKGSIPSSFNWTIDTKAPSTSIFSATDGNNNFMAPGSNTSSSTAIFEFSANDTGGSEDKGVGIKQIECSIDSSNFTACVSPVEITPDILTDGNHSFKVRAEDNVGNMNPEPASFSWTIDTVSPTTIISNVVDGNNSTITNSSNTKSNGVMFEFSGNDTGVGISNFECSIDNSNFSTCSSPVQSINLTEGDHTVKIRAQDSVGNIGVSPASFSWSVDTEAPLTSINSVTDGNNTAISTGGNTSSNTVMFEFSGTDSGVGLSHFECSLDESEFITCSSPLQINSLTDGIHTLETRAHDNVGNKDLSLASFTWTVDTVPPLTSIVSASDGNRSAIKNGGNTSSSTAIFGFSAIDSGGRENKGVGIDQFECNIDNSNLVACTSPLEFNSLKEGTHNLKIFSKDNVGNMRSSPVSYTWTVDTIQPLSSINSAIDGNNQTLDNNDNSSSSSIEFTFTGSDSGGVGMAHLECSLDGRSFNICSSPVQYSSTNISDGAHILEVRAEDKVGNISPPSSFTWTVDTVPPDAIIDSATDGNGTIVNTGGNISSNSMIFNFSGIDSGGKEGSGVGIDHFECSLDNSNFTACNGPVRANNMADGTHILEVRAEDNVGNISPSPSSFTWTVDTTAPTTSIDFAIDGIKDTVTNGGDTKSNSMTFAFSGNDTGVGISNFECRIDNSNYIACTSPVQLSNLTDGEHLIEVRAKDNVGNMGASPTSFIWIVDTIPPGTIIDSVTDGHDEIIIMDGNSSSNSIIVEFSGTDSGVGVDHFECSIDTSDFVTCTSPLQFDSLSDGTHTLDVISEDNSTNKDPSPALFRWTVDTTPPETSVNSVLDVNQSSISNGGSTKSTSITFSFSGTDIGGVDIDHFECSIDNSDFVTCMTPVQFSNLEDGAHILQMRSEDNVGNVGPSPASFTWTVDTTPPATSINSATDGNESAVTNGGPTKSTSMTFTFSGTDTGGVDHFECSLDNSNFTMCISPIQFTSVNLDDGTHTFRVLSEDNSTNKDPSPATFTWTVDTVSPSTTVVSAIDGNRTSVQADGNTSSNSMTFAFSANDTGGDEGKGVGINHFECNIDNSKFVTCTSPFTFRNVLKDGKHTFNVLSEDNSRNRDTSPASFTWTVDTTPPATSINSATDGNKSAVTNGDTTKSTSMTFTFSGNDTGGVGIDHFECNVDGLTFVTCTSPFTFPSSSEDGQYTLEVRAHDRVGNRDPSSASFTWTVDTSPPTTTIDSATDGNNTVINAGGNSSSNSMIFLFSSIDSGVGVDHSECSIDNSKFAVCTSPIHTSTNLEDGTHILQIISEDKVGNRGSSPASFNWTVDTVAPTTTIDSATDGNKSAVTSDGSTKSTSMTFTFSGNDTNGVGIDHFECSIDDDEFVTCTSPFTFPNLLEDGTHTFRVMSEDKVGNKGSIPSSFNWTIDTEAPSASIFSATDGNNNLIAPGSNTPSNSMTFEFSANDTGGSEDKGVGIKQIECSIDNSNFTACVSPVEITPNTLTDGNHSFEVRAEDNVGNMDSSPASFSWTIDTVPPTTIISNVVDGNKSSITNGSSTKSNAVMFEFSGNDTGVGIDHLECSLDGRSFSACTSSVQFTSANITDGTHTFEVLSVDNSTNKDPSPASFTWTVDTTPPATSINSATDGNKSAVTNGSTTKSTSMTFTFSGNDTGGVGIDHFECNVDGLTFVTCTSPFTFPSLSEDGQYTLEIRAHDRVGNRDPSSASFTWTVDTSPPDTTIDSATDGNNTVINAGGNSSSNSMIFLFSSIDSGVGVDHSECSIDNSKFTVCTSPIQFTPTNLEDGTHILQIISEDKVGNRGSSPASFNWTVDTVAPTTTIDSATDGNKSAVTSDGSTKSTSMTFTFSGNDTNGVGIDHFECSIDDDEFVTCTSPFTFPNLLEDGTHSFRVMSEDKVGNRGSSPASFNWTVDTVAPTAKIDSATDGNKSAVTSDGSTKSTSMTFTFSGNDTGGIGIDHFECSIDSSNFVTCTSPFTFPSLLKDGTHTFRVMSEDKVGNRGSSPALFNWTVDTVAPTTTIDSVADSNDNPITTGGNSSSNKAVITFSGIDTGGNEGQGVGINHFECSIDGESFTNCSTPLELSELDDGAHTIEISSFDNVGNSDRSPASFIWTIDTVQPNTSITSAIDGNRNTVTAGGNTSSTSMNFAFSGTDRVSGIDHFECSIDGAPFDVCASPILFSNLADGSHALEVRAEDNVVNLDSSPAFFNWTIDTSPPTTSIDSVVDNNRNRLANDSNTRSNSITFTFSGTDAGEAEIKRFECSIDNSDFVTCTSPFGFPNLVSDGSHTFRVRAEDNSGNKDATAELFTWNVDTTPPPANIDTAIDGNNSTVPNGSNTTSTSIAFTFSGTDIGLGLDHFECSIDGASFTLCNSPVQFESLPDGTHTLEVRAEDKVGNEGPTPTAFIWTVSTKPPNTTINSVTDGNKNIVANNSNTRSNTLTITFSATDIIANVDHFECSIDDVEFVTCTSPFTFPNLLSDGSHTFRVRAEDNSGHEDASPALYTWTVDSVAPTTTIISATDGNRNTISSGGGTPSTSMIFTFSGTDAGVGLDHFECSIDGATFEACTSPAQFDNLGSGVHTVDIRAIDSVGNQGVSPAPFRWNVDATPPDTTINSATDGNNNSVNNGGNSSSTSIAFTFSGSDIGVGLDRFECSIDGSSFSACDSPVQFTSLSLGGHTLEVRAVDKVENAAETPTVFLWTITTPPPPQLPPSVPQNITTLVPQNITTPVPENITTPPPPQPPQQLPPSVPENITTSPPIGANQSIVTNETTQIPASGEAPDTKVVSGVDGSANAVANDGITPSKSITFVLSASIDGVEAADINNFECSIDGSSFSACTSPAQFSNLSEGAHILEVVSLDNSGKRDPSPASFTWTVDTEPPDTIIDSAIDGNNRTLTDGSNTESISIAFTFSGTDTSIEEGEEVGIDHFECSVDGSSFSTCTSPVQYDNLSIGSHNVEIRTEDNAGNKDPSPSSFTWTVNTIQQDDKVVNNITSTPPIVSDLPDTVINSTTDGSSNVINNETSTASSTIRFEFSTTNVEALDHFECSMDDSDFVPCTSPFIFPILPEGKHVFMVRFVDVNGNMDESPATFVWDITG